MPHALHLAANPRRRGGARGPRKHKVQRTQRKYLSRCTTTVGREARQCPAPDRGSGQLQRNSRMKKTRDWLQLSRTSILPYARTPLRPARYASRVFFGILLRATDHCRTSHSGVGTTRVTSMAHPSSRISRHRSACVFLCSRMKNTHGPCT